MEILKQSAGKMGLNVLACVASLDSAVALAARHFGTTDRFVIDTEDVTPLRRANLRAEGPLLVIAHVDRLLEGPSCAAFADWLEYHGGEQDHDHDHDDGDAGLPKRSGVLLLGSSAPWFIQRGSVLGQEHPHSVLALVPVAMVRGRDAIVEEGAAFVLLAPAGNSCSSKEQDLPRTIDPVLRFALDAGYLASALGDDDANPRAVLATLREQVSGGLWDGAASNSGARCWAVARCADGKVPTMEGGFAVDTETSLSVRIQLSREVAADDVRAIAQSIGLAGYRTGLVLSVTADGRDVTVRATLATIAPVLTLCTQDASLSPFARPCPDGFPLRLRLLSDLVRRTTEGTWRAEFVAGLGDGLRSTGGDAAAQQVTADHQSARVSEGGDSDGLWTIASVRVAPEVLGGDSDAVGRFGVDVLARFHGATSVEATYVEVLSTVSMQEAAASLTLRVRLPCCGCDGPFADVPAAVAAGSSRVSRASGETLGAAIAWALDSSPEVAAAMERRVAAAVAMTKARLEEEDERDASWWGYLGMATGGGDDDGAQGAASPGRGTQRFVIASTPATVRADGESDAAADEQDSPSA